MPLPKIKPQNQGSVPQEGTKTEPGQIPASRASLPTHRDGLMIPPRMKLRALASLNAALKATRSQHGSKGEGLKTEADHATRVKAAELILAYAEGRPVERSVKLTGDFSNYDDRLEKLCSTPEGLRIAINAGLVETPAKTVKTIGKQGSISIPVETEGGTETASS